MGFSTNSGGGASRAPSFTVAQFVLAAVVLTALVILGIKTFVSGDKEAAAPAAQTGNPFNDGAPAAPAGYNPAARRESLGSGGSIEMFAKTNAGYAGEDEAQASSSTARNPDELSSPAGAALKKEAAKAGTAPAAPAATVIPRMQAVKSFGSKPPVGGRGAAPDISAIVKGAMGAAPKKAGDKR